MKFPPLFALACGLASPFCQGQTLVGRPCLFNEYFPEWRCFPAILRDDQGNLTCGRNRLNNGGVTSAPPAAGPVCSTATRLPSGEGPLFHFVYGDGMGGIQDLWQTRRREMDTWHSLKLNNGGATQAPLGVGNPSGFFDGNYHVVYRDPDGGVQDLVLDGSWGWETLNRNGKTCAPAAAGDPVQAQLQGRRHVLYRDLDGSIQDLWFDKGWHGRRLNNGGLTAAPGAAGEPAALEHRRITHVVYRDRAGQVQDLSCTGSWQVQRLTGEGNTGAPPAAGDPSLTVGEDDVRHVTYRDAQGGLQDLTFDGTWHVRRLNNGGATEGPPAASEPFLMLPPSRWEFVAYVDIHGAGQLLVHGPKKGWRITPLNAATPPGAPPEKTLD